MSDYMTSMNYIADKTIDVLNSCETAAQLLNGRRYARRAMRMLSGNAYRRVRDCYEQSPPDYILHLRIEKGQKIDMRKANLQGADLSGTGIILKLTGE